MDIHITIEGRRDLTGQLYRQLRSGILDGRLPAGERLPSTRDLATQLGVSRKTTLEAFERLGAEGYLVSRPGDGTFVAEGLMRLPAKTERGQSAPSTADASHARHKTVLPRALPVWGAFTDARSLPRPTDALDADFAGGVTDKTQFPFDAWRRCVHHALRIQARGRGTYREAAGDPDLRLAIARYLAYSRAVASDPDGVVVTQGAQQAIDLLARVMIRPGDVVAVEDPGYPPVRSCFAALGARVADIPVDAQGLVVAKLPDDARIVYVTPSHQFPLGMPMSLERRVELLEWARHRGALIIEDDYDGEFRFEGRPMEPLKSLDRAGLVAYVGTFSKTIFPELRIGYCVPPATLVDALLKVRFVTDHHSCALTQSALAQFMLGGDFAKHLRRIHKHYSARRERVLAHLHGGLSAWLDPIVPVAGIHLVALLAPPLDEARVIGAAREAGVGLHGLSMFFNKAPARNGFLFGYGGVDADTIDRGLGRLAGVLRELTV
ncbi:PLP-dependent aminotransferase family protein [Pararobbsia silviterrae]|uniref:PLP-dependent aminotransferase family protein n=1 Tax=Pararobbsia silviterrae TaxID=1792498 RepID=A0A494Y791_9BURK|nr:PLP-dependent aminotransferase family protein [Pararobbsia silviterrae]RKP56481.1 PLP-dependent aminotransferase family protein [Pararobbsia silviterrae]